MFRQKRGLFLSRSLSIHFCMRKGVYVVGLIFIFGFTGLPDLTPYSFPELKFFPEMPLSESNPVTVQGAELGKYLFYDPVLSDDRKLSCSSCHKQEYAFSDGPVQFSKGKSGVLMKRNTPGLFNLAWYPAMFWDGKAKSIEEQVFHPVRAGDEMNMSWKEVEKRVQEIEFYRTGFKNVFGDQSIDSVLISKAIAQFLRTLLSYRSRYDKGISKEIRFTDKEYAGYVLMNDQTKGDCLHCHTTDADALGTMRTFSNNGLDEVSKPGEYKDKGRGEVTGNVKENGQFKIPTLRNLVLTAPYMHDGRFKTLEEVLDFYSEGVKQSPNIDSRMEFVHQHGAHLSPEEKKDIIVFLKTMTDSSLISDPAFSDPFGKK
jgi:cytochrome c peroxidase